MKKQTTACLTLILLSFQSCVEAQVQPVKVSMPVNWVDSITDTSFERALFSQESTLVSLITISDLNFDTHSSFRLRLFLCRETCESINIDSPYYMGQVLLSPLNGSEVSFSFNQEKFFSRLIQNQDLTFSELKKLKLVAMPVNSKTNQTLKDVNFSIADNRVYIKAGN